MPPNPLPLPTMALLKSGYVLLVTVCITLSLLILGLILMRRVDKTDLDKVGKHFFDSMYFEPIVAGYRPLSA